MAAQYFPRDQVDFGRVVALRLAVDKLIALGGDCRRPDRGQGRGRFRGMYQGTAVLDLDYDEDSNAQEADGNFVLTGSQIVEGMEAEGATGDEEGLLRLLRLRASAAARFRGAGEGRWVGSFFGSPRT